MELFSGFIIGLVGSLHCIGMCGPIAVALPSDFSSKLNLMLSRVLYNFGRVLTYTLLGLIFGLLGKRISLVGLQQAASISIGVIILISVITPNKMKQKVIEFSIFRKFNEYFSNTFKKVMNIKGIKNFLYVGILNGFLPCGFVYVGIGGAITTGSVVESGIYMLLFGLGTVPVMLGTSMITNFFSFSKRMKIRKLIPYLAALLAIIFILRGLNLGIPFISPKLDKKANLENVICH